MKRTQQQIKEAKHGAYSIIKKMNIRKLRRLEEFKFWKKRQKRHISSIKI